MIIKQSHIGTRKKTLCIKRLYGCKRPPYLGGANMRHGQPRRKAVLKTHAIQTLRDCRTPSNRAKRLDCGAFTAAFSGRRDGRSGVPAERRHLKKSGIICGGLPTRRYEAGELSAVPLKFRATGFAGRSVEKPETCKSCSFSPGEKVRLRAGVNINPFLRKKLD
jgi:hypothetical protein